MKKIKFILISFILLNAISLIAQSGKSFGEFNNDLEPYFDKSMINDIKSQLPVGTDYKIWGWDVGDFSGDGFADVAFSVKLKSDNRKRMNVYLFVDIDGFLTKVGSFSYFFIETPLEIGVAIRNNSVSITQKNKQFNWNISSYSFENGILYHKEEYHTQRIGDLTYQKTMNYKDLFNLEKYVYTKSNEVAFEREYSTLLSYPRGKQIFKGYEKQNYINDIDYVYDGAWHWSGDKDLSYNVESSHDEEYLYFSVNIIDDKLVAQSCDTCLFDKSERLIKTCDTCFCDYLELWLDIYSPDSTGDRFMNRVNNIIKFRPPSFNGIMKFTVYPGDFYTQKASIEISTNEYLNSLQKFETSKLKAMSNLTDSGYTVKFKIPFTLLGYSGNPISGNEIFELGAAISVIDFDNKFREEERTSLANCCFVSFNPTTYASLMLIPQHLWYGNASNIFELDVIQALKEYGY